VEFDELILFKAHKSDDRGEIETMSVKKIIGFSIRSYRTSPFYPRLGKLLAKLLSFIVYFLPAKTVTREINGIRYELDLTQVIDASLFYAGAFETQAETTIATYVRAGTTAVDIGANIGYHTFSMARLVGTEGKVLAIEPTSWAFSKLRRNAQLNNFHNVSFLKVGLTDRDIGETEATFQSSYRLDGMHSERQECVFMTTLDTVLKEHGLPAVGFIKCDVDGFEGKVFRGAEETLRRCRPVILFEISPAAMRVNGDEATELIERLQTIGYLFNSEAGEPILDIKRYCSGIGEGLSKNLLALPCSVTTDFHLLTSPHRPSSRSLA
jgi:FkbM family methyltransferase